jgi:hypothetical protein
MRLERWLIPDYARERREGNTEDTERLLEIICNQSFSSVLWHLLRGARMPDAIELLPADCLRALFEFGDDIARAAGFTD